MYNPLMSQIALDQRDELLQSAEDRRLVEIARARRPRHNKYLAANLGNFLNMLGPWLKTQYRSLRGDHVASFINSEIKEKVQ